MSAATAIGPKLANEGASVNGEAWLLVQELGCELTVDVSLPGFKVADVLRLQRNTVINSHWPVGSDVPIRVNTKLMARGEFEVVDDHLAVRLTELP
jgi:flagellar motor switch/type III secretory pathway protein FliN